MITRTADCPIYYDLKKKKPKQNKPPPTYKLDPGKATDIPYNLYCKWTEVTELG